MKYLFEWTPEISVNNAIIDGQHQRLLGQVNTLISYVVSDKFDAVVTDAVVFLDKYINEHFVYEEQYMMEYKFPEIEAHKILHADFIFHYKKFKERMNAGVSRETLAMEIEQYIGNWWLEHIAKEDKKYADYIKNHEA
jgi:hemerythrin-like metal-binding protein